MPVVCSWLQTREACDLAGAQSMARQLKAGETVNRVKSKLGNSEKTQYQKFHTLRIVNQAYWRSRVPEIA